MYVVTLSFLPIDDQFPCDILLRPPVLVSAGADRGGFCKQGRLGEVGRGGEGGHERGVEGGGGGRGASEGGGRQGFQGEHIGNYLISSPRYVARKSLGGVLVPSGGAMTGR